MNKKKLLALLMALVMTFSLIPTTVWAADSALTEEELLTLHNAQEHFGITFMAKIDDEEYNNLAEFFVAYTQTTTATVTLLSDIAIPRNGVYIPVAAGQTITLDFNGHRILKNNTGYYACTGAAIEVKSGGTLTLKGTGGIDGVDSCVKVEAGGKLTVDGGTFTTTQATSGSSAINNAGTLELNGGSVNATYYAIYNSGSATVNGGTVTSTSTASSGDWAYAISSNGELTVPAESTLSVSGAHGGLAVVGGTASIAGGEYSATDYYGLYVANTSGSAVVTVSGGSFSGSTNAVLLNKENSSNDASSLTITGGTFNHDPSAYVDEGYAVCANTDSASHPYTVVQLPSASVVRYNITEVSDEQIAALMNNIDGGFVRAYETINGTDLYPYGNSSISTAATDVFLFTAADEDNDTITEAYGDSWYCDFVVSFDKDVKADSVILTGAYGEMLYSILLGKNFTANETKQFLISSVGYDFTYRNILTVVQSFLCTIINIDSANIGTTASVSLVMWPTDGNKETDSVTIATIPYTFTEDNLSYVKIVDTQYRHVAAGLGVNSFVITTDNSIVEQTEAGPHFAPVTYVAQIGTTQYTTLQAAFSAAQDGQTITLLDNVSLTERLFVNAGANPAYAGSNNRYATTSVDKSITLELNGKNITSSSNIALAGGSLNITGTGKISTTASGLAPVEIRGTGDLATKRTLTIGQNVTLEGEEYGLNVFGSNDAQENVIDVNVNGTVKGMLFVLGNLKNADNAINIVVNGTVDASGATGSEKVHTGIAISGNANVTVNNGATVTGESGIEVRAGSLTVNGGTITATADSYSYVANGSGTTTKGAAIAVAQHNTKLPVNATLNGGTLEGVKQISVTDVNSDMSAVNVVASESYTQNSVIPEGYKWVNGATAGTKTLAKITPVARVGEEEYTTLEDAVKAITGTTGTITLLANIDLAVDPLTVGGYAAVAPANKTITLDLNTHTISGGALDVYGTLTITGNGTITGSKHGIWVNEGGVLNVQDGTITTDGVGYPVIANPGTVNISGGTVTNGTTGAGAVYVNDGTLTISGGAVTSTVDDTAAVTVTGNTVATISGGTVTGHDWGVTVFDTAKLTVSGNATIGTAENEGYAICTNGNGGQNATVIIEDGNITGTELGIYQPSGKLTVTGGTITGATGIYFKSNSLNITGGTITGNGEPAEYTYNGNGAHPTGDALVIDSCNYPNGINDVSVSGGNFNSTKAKAVGSYYGSTATAAVTNFITGGKYSSEPNSSYVADGYKAAKISGDTYKFQVGVVDVASTIEGSINDSSVTLNVTTTVEEYKGSTNPPLESNTNLSVTVTGTSNEVVNGGNAATAAAALTNIKDNDTLKKIVSSAIEAAGASITSSTENANVTIQLAKSGATVESGKVTYEVHPEAIIQVDNKTVGTVALNNSQIKGSFTFKLYAGNIPGGVDGKKILVTHTHDDGTTEDHGPYTVESGYITLTGITSFSDFTLEAIEENTTVLAKYSYSLSLEDSIKINFKVKDLLDEPERYTVAYGFGDTPDGSWKVETLKNNDLNSFEIGSFAAKEMGNEVHVIVYHDGVMIKQAYYSVKSYCDTVINGNYGAEITALCKATLDYGRYAQEAFNYNKEALVNGGNDYFTNSNIVVPAATSIKNDEGSNVTGVSLSLITTAETQLVARFKTPVKPTSVTIDGTSDDSWDYTDSVVKVTATGISASDLDKDVTFVVYDNGGTYTYTVSPTYYMYQAINYKSQVELNRAFYNYYLKAEAYFATKNK